MTSASLSGSLRAIPNAPKARILWAFAIALMVAGVIAMVRLPIPWNDELQQAVAKRTAADQPPTVDQYIDLTLWWAAAAAAIIGALLTASHKLWTSRYAPVTEPLTSKAERRSTRITMWVALIAITAIAAFARAPRLDHSFWNDEEVTIQDYSWGKYSKQKVAGEAAELKFKPASWEKTLFYNRGGSNHVLNSALTKLTIQTDNAIRGNDGNFFSERTARIVPFLASLGTVLLIGWIGWRGFHPIAGIVAAATLALSPWHIRYSTEIRGYSLLLFLILVALVCLFLALHSGKRRYWVGFAIAEAGFMLSFFASVYVAVALNLAALAWIVTSGRSKSQLVEPTYRLLAANLAAAAIFIPLAAPSIPQFLYYLENPLIHGFAPGWLNDFYHHLVLGVPPWERSGELNAGITAPQLFAQAPWVESLLWRIVPAVVGLGIISALITRDRRQILLIAALTAGPVLGYLHNRLVDSPALPWYLLYSLLPFALLCGYACSLLLTAVKKPTTRLPLVLSSLVAAAWLTAYAIATQPQREHLAAVPRQPLREVAAELRGNAPTFGTPEIKDRVTAAVGFSVKRLRTYDPHIHTLRSVKDLRKVDEQATAAQLPVFIAVCGESLIAKDPKKKACLDYLHDPANGFTKYSRILGFETQFSYDIYSKEPSFQASTK
ncbi:glycosyltransferase family 39 protein [Sulfuriroseicoccus oceanibius]|uniref:Glycosyltransferase family 39 protein n=1 Tax=Sulfuriroseicoccus oceanibius TaxID=2707525 RepID=A0A6B3L1V1_9BACT|nr:glycosyltransferase family 39 protein [Sulfuriroseicoccus oceanibius]QQL43679.1 glycosyltransferase family 39 protein [Sulfuriroseicoccus oceanibius]